MLHRLAKAIAWAGAIITPVLFAPGTALAVPSFAVQTGQPCAACHVGAFGPRLTSYGRDFKLFGYTAAKPKVEAPHLAMFVQSSLTHTQVDQATPPAEGFGRNNNFAVDQISLLYAGRITDNVGAFLQGTFDGTTQTAAWDNMDVRWAKDMDVFGSDLVLGITANNNPTVEDLWSTTPAWSFPFSASSLAPVPQASTLIESNIGQRVIGLGAYAMWNDWIYLDGTVYTSPGNDALSRLGEPVVGQDKIQGATPYGRVAVQHGWGSHYGEIGAFGLRSSAYPGGDPSAGKTDTLTDIGFDASYQWTANPHKVDSDVLAVDGVVIHENENLAASSVLSGTNGTDTLTTVKADLSYAIDATYIPTFQYFQILGNSDPGRWISSPNGSPNTRGYITELAYVPFGKPDSPINWGNLRLQLQYVGYTEFNGTSAHASDNNTLYLNVWIALGIPDLSQSSH
ncbi:MAG: hypothetical protein M0006_01785 [Magnetospirillum sp.]|nr:hypothetical protein [Magnetospirillum sp.]